MKLLDLNDPLWKAYPGAYGSVREEVGVLMGEPAGPQLQLRRLKEQAEDDEHLAFDNLCESLSHQMTFYPAMYLVLPYMVKFLGLKSGDYEWERLIFSEIGQCLAADVFWEGEKPPAAPEEILESYREAMALLAEQAKQFPARYRKQLRKEGTFERRWLILGLYGFLGDRLEAYVMNLHAWESCYVQCGRCGFLDEDLTLSDPKQRRKLRPVRPWKKSARSFQQFRKYLHIMGDWEGEELLAWYYGTYTCPECGKVQPTMEALIRAFDPNFQEMQEAPAEEKPSVLRKIPILRKAPSELLKTVRKAETTKAEKPSGTKKEARTAEAAKNETGEKTAVQKFSIPHKISLEPPEPGRTEAGKSSGTKPKPGTTETGKSPGTEPKPQTTKADKSPETKTTEAVKSPETKTTEAVKSPETKTTEAVKSPETKTTEAVKSPGTKPNPARKIELPEPVPDVMEDNALTRAMELCGDYPSVCALAERGEYQEAADWCLKYLASVPDWRLHVLRAYCFKAMGRTPELDRCLTAALELEPDNILLLRARCPTISTKTRYRRQIGDLTRLLELDPGNRLCYLISRAYRHHWTGDDRAARQDLRDARSEWPDIGLQSEDFRALWEELGPPETPSGNYQ